MIPPTIKKVGHVNGFFNKRRLDLIAMDVIFPACALSLVRYSARFLMCLFTAFPETNRSSAPARIVRGAINAIRPWENVPLASFVLLRGKCSACKHPISPRYPLVELFTACAALALWRFVIMPQLVSAPTYWHMGVSCFAVASCSSCSFL